MNTISIAELRLPYKRVIAFYEVVAMGEDYLEDNSDPYRPAPVVTL